MVRAQTPLYKIFLTLICGATLLTAGCSTSRQASQSPSLDSLTTLDVSPQDTTLAIRYFVRGLTYLQKESYDTAILYYRRALPHTSDSAAVFSSLAEAFSHQGNSERAVSFSGKAVEANPERRDYHYQLATLQEEADMFADAITTYRSLVERFPGETRAYHAMGKLHLRRDSIDQAIEIFERLMDEPGQHARAGYELLQIYRREGDLAGMAQTLESLIEVAPSNPDLYFMLTDVYQEQGNLQAAVEILQNLREQLPDNAEAAFRLVGLYHDVGASEKAEKLLRETLEMEDLKTDVLYEHARALYFEPEADQRTNQTVYHLLERVLEQNPNHGGALYMLGTIHLERGAHAEAFQVLERAVEETPRNQDAWVRALLAGVHEGRYDRVVELAEEALVLFPRQFSLLRLAGVACVRSDRNREGVEYLTEALDSRQAEEVGDEVRSNVAAMLGMLYDRLDDVAQSDSLYERALTWNRTNETALNNYAYSLAERGVHLEKALEMARRAVDLAPKSASLMDTLGWVYFKMERLDEAAVWIKRALETGHASAEVHEHYGDIQRQLGNDTKALEYWKKAARLNPDDTTVEEKIQQAESPQ